MSDALTGRGAFSCHGRELFPLIDAAAVGAMAVIINPSMGSPRRRRPERIKAAHGDPQGIPELPGHRLNRRVQFHEAEEQRLDGGNVGMLHGQDSTKFPIGVAPK